MNDPTKKGTAGEARSFYLLVRRSA